MITRVTGPRHVAADGDSRVPTEHGTRDRAINKNNDLTPSILLITSRQSFATDYVISVV